MLHYISIGQQIKRLRKRIGMRQADLAKQIGTTKSDISDLERGQKSCSIDRLAAIAEKLNADLEIDLRPRNGS